MIKYYVCKICKSKYVKKNMLQVVCSVTCAIELAKKKEQKELQKQKVEERKAWKQKKERLRAELTGGSDALQIAVNHIARLLDKDEKCIARPGEQHYEYHGGHVWNTNSYPAIRYNLWNIWKQSKKSNTWMQGERQLMLEGIEERCGRETREMVENLPKQYPVMQFREWELKEALKKANQIIRELKAGEIYTRDTVNEKIGLYLH